MTKQEHIETIYEEMDANLNLWIQHKDEKALERYHKLADYVSRIDKPLNS